MGEQNDDYPEGFDNSCGIPAWAMKRANMTAAGLTGSREWDVPHIAQAIVTGKPGEHSRRRPVNRDQVAWMLAAIKRYLPPQSGPWVSREREMQKYAMFYELMEVANLCFEDESAQHNATPPDVAHLRWESKQAESDAWAALVRNKSDGGGNKPSAPDLLAENI